MIKRSRSTQLVEANFLIACTQKGSLSKAQGTTCVGLDNLEELSFFNWTPFKAIEGSQDVRPT